MGKKYIINFEDNPGIAPNREKYYKCCEIPWWVAAECTLSKLTPYTEPDLAYQRGLNDAWECMKKIIHIVHDQGTMIDLFGCRTFGVLLKQYTPSECIEKIRQYEQKKKKQDELRQNIQTIVDQCGYTLDEIVEVLQKMKEA